MEALALLFFMAPNMVAWGQTRTEVTYDFSAITGFDQWGTSYSQHVVEYDDATVTFASANHQTSTITDIPVTKGQPVSLVLKDQNKDQNNQITSATFVCRQWGTKTQTITLHYSTDGGQSYTSTGVTSTNFTISSNSLPEGTNAVKITFSNTSNQVGIASATIAFSASTSTAVATAVTIDDTNLTNTDVYVGTEAGSLSATVTAGETTISGAMVTWTSSNEEVATIDANGVVTLVAAGTTTITAAYAGVEGQYLSSSATYALEVTDSTPFTGGDVTFIAGTDLGSTTSNADGDEMTKSVVTVSSTSAAFATAEYRIYSGSTTTISTTYGVITQIAFTKTGSYSLANLSTQNGYDSETGIWTGSATSITFSASAQVRLSQIVVTVAAPADVASPVFSPEAGTYFETQSVTISCETANATIYYTIDGTEPTNESTQYTGAITVAETTTIKAIAYVGTDHSFVATAIYTIEQPLSTIQEIFDAATTTATAHRINFNNWVITGANNSNHAFLSDGTNGCMIYGSGHGFTAGDVLSGIVECNIQKYNGALELTGLNSSTTGLTVTEGGTVTVANIAMAELAAINTGALVSYQNLTCSVTTSGNYTNYYLTDGTTQIQAYTTLYNDLASSLENGKIYNITGIFVQNNSIKRINPRSAEDIEEVEVQHEEYTLTVSNLVNVNTYVFAGDESEMLFEGEGSADIYDGTEVMVSVDVEEGYVLQSLMVDGVEHASDLDGGMYIFTMPTHDVTITATAVEYVAPTGGDYVRITSLDQLTDGSVVIIAARHNTTTNSYFAMKNNTSGKPEGTQFTSAIEGDNEAISSTISEEEDSYSWIVNVTDDGFTFTNSTNNLIGYSSSTNFSTGGDNTVWTIERSTAGNSAMVAGYEGFVIKNKNNNTRAIAFNGTVFGPYAWTNNNAAGYNFYLDFFVQTEAVEPESHTLTIDGYGTSNGGYYLIASPVTVNIADVEGLTEGDFDLYTFNQAAANEWINYEQGNDSHPFTKLEPGKGYLYAHKTGGDFILNGTPYTGNGEIELVYTEDGDFPGWNLVGNPYATTATITTTSGSDKPFYVMNEGGTEVEPSDTDQVAAMQGVFVVADGANQTVTFTEGSGTTNTSKIVVNVRQNRGNVIDRAIVRFGQGEQLPKFMLNEDNTKIYIPQGTEDYAVVRSNNQGEMPVSFKAAENGTYTLSIVAQNTEMEYLHLIDNKTGADIDLLSTPNYTFQANTTDYANRFQLVFNANTGINELSSDRFATFNGNEWMIRNQGEATLQVIDMTGRVLRSETIDGNATLRLDETQGVYVIRLIQNGQVSNQKVVKE